MAALNVVRMKREMAGEKLRVPKTCSVKPSKMCEIYE